MKTLILAVVVAGTLSLPAFAERRAPAEILDNHDIPGKCGLRPDYFWVWYVAHCTFYHGM